MKSSFWTRHRTLAFRIRSGWSFSLTLPKIHVRRLCILSSTPTEVNGRTYAGRGDPADIKIARDSCRKSLINRMPSPTAPLQGVSLRNLLLLLGSLDLNPLSCSRLRTQSCADPWL